MAIPSAIYLVVYAFAASFCVTLTVLNWRAWRRQVKLDQMLYHLCIQAWLMRQYPLFYDWLQYAELELQVVPKRKQQ